MSVGPNRTMDTDCCTLYTTGDSGRHWKKPDEVMKLRKKKASLSSSKRTLEKRSAAMSLSPKPPKPNPFKTKSSDIKRLGKENKANILSRGNLLKIEEPQRVPLRAVENTILQDMLLSPNKVYNNVPMHNDFPTDWSLKTKARFTSQHNFLWCSAVKSFEEASGITNFTRCSTNDNLATNLPHQSQAMFQQCLMQWVHPDTALAATGLTESVLSHIRQQWSISFNSLYHLYQAGLCPYFYVIAQNFVVLFLLKGFAGTQANTVYVTPTTTGLRKALRSEGITFNMPLAETKPGSEEDTTAGSDDDDALWMDSMGIMQERTTIISTLDGSQLDHQPSSLVQIEGKQIHAFFNYFLNYQIGHKVSMPATLLSPIAFEGGVLRSLKYQQGKTKEYKSKKKYKETHYLEISGYIMPQQLTQLCRLMGQAQNGEYSVTLFTRTFTAAFNFPRKCDLQECATEILPLAGLSADDVKHFTVTSSLDKNSLRHLHCSNNKYTWEV